MPRLDRVVPVAGIRGHLKAMLGRVADTIDGEIIAGSDLPKWSVGIRPIMPGG